MNLYELKKLSKAGRLPAMEVLRDSIFCVSVFPAEKRNEACIPAKKLINVVYPRVIAYKKSFLKGVGEDEPLRKNYFRLSCPGAYFVCCRRTVDLRVDQIRLFLSC